jgi:hypothetical protein
MHAYGLPDGVRRQELNVVALGIASGLLYGIVYAAERQIFLNGLALNGIGEAANVPRLALGVAAYVGASLLLFGLYVRLLWLCSRGRLVGRSRALALVFPVLFHIGWCASTPYLSRDAFTYLAHGYLGVLPGGNPHLQPVTNVVGTAFGDELARYGWRGIDDVTVYGPLWTHLETLALRLTSDVVTALLILKAIIVMASLGSAALIWSILGRVRPEVQLLGTLGYLANPLIVIELAGEGHNDALMVFFVLTALFFAVLWRPAASLVALLLGALTKYLPLILLPPLVVFFWRGARSRTEVARSAIVALIAGAAATIIAYGPFWGGSATIQGVLTAGGGRSVQSSVSGTLVWALERWIPTADAARFTSLLLVAVFGIISLVAMARARGPKGLIVASTVIALTYVLVASPYVWPWHAVLPVALAALSPRSALFLVAALLSLCGRLVAPLDDVQLNGFIAYRVEAIITTAVFIGIPLIAACVAAYRLRRQVWSSAPIAEMGSAY